MLGKPGNPFDSPHFRGGHTVKVEGDKVSNFTEAKEEILVNAIVAMRDFCRSVEEGTVSSRRTYARFKEILRRYDAL